MGRYNFAALRVRQSVINQKANGKIRKLPEWVDILRDIPPSQVVVRPQAQKHWEPYAQRSLKAPKSKKPSRMFQPQEIVFEEDQLRKEFFRDHPWELARPRILVESSGNDSARYDWSRIQQPGKKLDGESVVQRQLWLLHNVPNMTKGNAYDIARREFYHLRQREDIARRVAAEEAEATGASFGPSRLEIGMQLENEEFERWKEWARSEAQGEFKEPGTSGIPEESSEDPYAAEESETVEEAPQQA